MGTRDNYTYLSGSRDTYTYDAYRREMEEWFRGTRAMCTIEVLVRDEKQNHVNIYGAYLDSLDIDGMKLTFTTIHDNRDTTIRLDKVAKVTINKEKK